MSRVGWAAALLVLGCASSDDEKAAYVAVGLGDACVPSAEEALVFSGFSSSEVTIETGHDECGSNLCLVNHFRGRVSCPYGQTEAEAAEVTTATFWGNRCRVPGTSGAQPTDRVMVPVSPQLVDRQAADAVYCSCRCADAQGSTAEGGPFCTCGPGFECAPLVADLGLSQPDLSGSFCIKAGTEYDQVTAMVSMDCDLAALNCGDAIP